MGASKLFGLMGGANLGYIAEFCNSGSGQYVGAAHESAAVSMADGYSRITGGLGLATVTHGPGVTNALTALTEAARARSAVVLLTSDTPSRREHTQWIDLRSVARVAGAAYRRAHTPQTAVDDVAQAIRLSCSTRTPVLLDVPRDILMKDVDYAAPRLRQVTNGPQAIGPDEESLDAAIGVAASANRPVVLAGRGAVLADAQTELTELADVLHAPLATTIMAMDYFKGHPRNLGIFGTESHSLAIRYLSQADCVVAVGASLNNYTTADGDLTAGKAVVHCDSDVRALGTRVPETVSVQADARVFVKALKEGIAALGPRSRSNWSLKLSDELRRFDPVSDFRDRSGRDTVDFRTAMATLDRLLPAERAVITDIGRAKTAAWRFLRCSPGQFSQTGAFGSIGLGLATAVGAAFARPERLTVSVAGDGGMMMSLPDVIPAIDHGLPLVIVVMNDAAFGAEQGGLARLGYDTRYSCRNVVSFARVARALGARGWTVRSVSDLERLREPLGELAGPAVIDLRGDPAVNPRSAE